MQVDRNQTPLNMNFTVPKSFINHLTEKGPKFVKIHLKSALLSFYVRLSIKQHNVVHDLAFRVFIFFQIHLLIRIEVQMAFSLPRTVAIQKKKSEEKCSNLFSFVFSIWKKFARKIAKLRI